MPEEPIKSLEDLRDQVTMLMGLLDDPQPGFISWAALYHERMTAINDFWTRKAE